KCKGFAIGIALAQELLNLVSFPVSLFIFIVFLNRYVFGLFLRLSRGKKGDPKRFGYEPTVTIVVPLYNEGESVYQTIKSFSKLDYPKHKLDCIVIDDCSTDDSYDWACKAAQDFPDVHVKVN